MADRARLMEALKNADAAGDDAAAGRIAGMIRALDQQAPAVAAPPQQEEPSILQNIMNSMSESGKNVRESVMNPGQAIPDALRTSSNFLTFGLRDRLGAALTDRTHEQEKAETAAADERLGSIDEALDVAAMMLPGPKKPLISPVTIGPKSIRPALDVGKRAGVYGAEEAGKSGVQAVIEGEDPLTAMMLGGAGGATGSVGGDWLQALSKKGPTQTYKTADDLFEAADKTKRTTRVGKDTIRASERAEAALKAQSGGQGAFKEMNDALNRQGRKAAGVSRGEGLALSKLAGKKDSVVPDVLKGLGNIVSGGSLPGRWALAAKLGFLPQVAGAGFNLAGSLAEKARKGDFNKYMQQILKSAGTTPGKQMSPELANTMRDLLARSGGTIGRN